MPAEPRDPTEQEPVDPIEALLEECLLRFPTEGTSALDELCREHPMHAAGLRDGFALLRGSGIVPPARTDVPERLGDFRIVERLGGGGMGAVFVAEQTSLQRRVALKLIRPELLFFGGSRERFRREAEAIARLQHPAIVPVFAWGEEQGVPYFAMELVEGCSLATVVAALAGLDPADLDGDDLARTVAERAGSTAASPWPLHGAWPAVAARIAMQIADALQHAHERGVLHRDVKPSNVVIGCDGRTRLLDFGLARTEGDVGITRSGTAIGSLAYMPPEQLLGRRDVDARSDVFSLGATLHELLALRRPFGGADAEQVRSAILDGRREPLQGRDRLGSDLETICAKALDPDPARRYATAAAMAADLDAALDGRPLAARRLGTIARLWRRARRERARTALLATLLLAVPTIAVVGTLWWQNREAGDVGRSYAERRAIAADIEAAFFAYKGAAQDEAQAGFDGVLARDPANGLALLGRLLCAFSTRDGAAMERVLAAHPDAVREHPMLRWLAAEAAELQGRSDEALRLRAAVPAVPPSHAVDWFVLGVVESILGQRGDLSHYGKALRALEQAIVLDRSEFRSPLFHVYAAETATLADDREAVLRMARGIEALWPDSAMALASAGRALMQADGARSVQLLERARDLAPGRAVLHSHLAESLLFQERVDEAAASYEAALQLDDRLGSAWGGLALVRMQQGRFDDAAECSRRYVAIDPELGVACKLLAQSLHLAGRTEAARDAYVRTLALMPDDRAVHQGLLAVLGQLGDTTAAAAEQERWQARERPR